MPDVDTNTSKPTTWNSYRYAWEETFADTE